MYLHFYLSIIIYLYCKGYISNINLLVLVFLSIILLYILKPLYEETRQLTGQLERICYIYFLVIHIHIIQYIPYSLIYCLFHTIRFPPLIPDFDDSLYTMIITLCLSSLYSHNLIYIPSLINGSEQIHSLFVVYIIFILGYLDTLWTEQGTNLELIS